MTSTQLPAPSLTEREAESVFASSVCSYAAAVVVVVGLLKGKGLYRVYF